MKDTVSAIKALRKAIEYNEFFAFAHYKLARLSARSGKINEANIEHDKFLHIWQKGDRNLSWFKWPLH
jgi:hypothetical protein